MLERVGGYLSHQNFCDGFDLALGRPAYSSSCFQTHTPGEAVDGLPDEDSCFWSAPGSSHWWSVDLEDELNIVKIRITNTVSGLCVGGGVCVCVWVGGVCVWGGGVCVCVGGGVFVCVCGWGGVFVYVCVVCVCVGGGCLCVCVWCVCGCKVFRLSKFSPIITCVFCSYMYLTSCNYACTYDKYWS